MVMAKDGFMENVASKEDPLPKALKFHNIFLLGVGVDCNVVFGVAAFSGLG